MILRVAASVASWVTLRWARASVCSARLQAVWAWLRFRLR